LSFFFFKLSSIFPKIFDFLELSNVLPCAFLSTNWHAVTTKYILLYQLLEGGVENDSERFVQLLADTNHHALVAERVLERQLCTHDEWLRLSVNKESSRLKEDVGDFECFYPGREQLPFSFCKAAGCTIMATCAMGHNTPSFQKKWEQVVSQRTALFGQLSMHKMDELIDDSSPGFDGYPVPTSFYDQDSCLRVVPAISQEQCDNAISLFRSYFSPDLYFIFPLVVRKLYFGRCLDFRTCSTWCVLDPDGQTKAALSWRMHNRLGTPTVAEVLFIATWEEQRGSSTGSYLVSALEQVARTAGAEMLYVEVGQEQPLAGNFWSWRHDFCVVQERFCVENSMQPPFENSQSTDRNDSTIDSVSTNTDNGCSIPHPLIRLEERWHVFFEFHCLRFSDTRQFVKILKK